MEIAELVRITSIPDVSQLSTTYVPMSKGMISVSSHHFIFSSSTPGMDIEVNSWICSYSTQMLLANIEDREIKASPRGTVFILGCRDFRRLCFMIPNEEHATALLATLEALTIPRMPRGSFLIS